MHASISQFNFYELLFIFLEDRFEWLALVEGKSLIIDPDHVVEMVMNVNSISDFENCWRRFFVYENGLLQKQ